MSRIQAMRFASLGSGSAGNATLIAADDQLILVDCGFSLKQTTARMAKLGCLPEQLTAILVTHEHGDHMGGVDVLARKHQLPVYITPGTLKAKPLSPKIEVVAIHSDTPFSLGSVKVEPVRVPHDAAEPVQFIFRWQQLKLGLLTDIGHITPHVVESYAQCQGLILEANHDTQMLASGDYHASLKRRVAGAWGHLNNQQTAGLLEQIETKQLEHLVLAHISLKNNALDRVRESMVPHLGGVDSVHYACQDEGFDWLELTHKSREKT